jgi:hypothetical protein
MATTTNAAELMIFVGRTGSGEGYRVYVPAEGLMDLDALDRRPNRIVAVEQVEGGGWVEGDHLPGLGSLPAPAVELYRSELSRRIDRALAVAGRIVRTADSHAAATNKSVTARLLAEGGRYALEVTTVSRWDGEPRRTVEVESVHDTLDAAKAAAWDRCESPYGDPYVPHA